MSICLKAFEKITFFQSITFFNLHVQVVWNTRPHLHHAANVDIDLKPCLHLK